MNLRHLILILCILSISPQGCAARENRPEKAEGRTPVRLLPKKPAPLGVESLTGIVGYAEKQPGINREQLLEIATADAEAKLSSHRHLKITTTTSSTATQREGERLPPSVRAAFHTISTHTSSGLIRSVIKKEWTDPSTGDLYLLVETR